MGKCKVYGRIGKRVVKSIEDFEDGGRCARWWKSVQSENTKVQVEETTQEQGSEIGELQIALDFIKSKGAKLVGIGNASIHERERDVDIRFALDVDSHIQRVG